MNPLYLDWEYAKKSPWGEMVAPPGLLAYGETVNGATDGFPGCHTIWRGVEFEWDKQLMAETPYNITTHLKDVVMVNSKFAGGKAAIQEYETVAKNLDGEKVGAYRTSWHRFSRKKAEGASKYKKNGERHIWTDDELTAVWEEYHNQNLKNRRGAEPLYYEDVEVGTEVPHIIKGPITMTSKLAFELLRGAGGWIVGHETAMDLWERSPNLAILNEENVPEPPIAIHWTNERCDKYLGMPGAYEAGYERLHWYTQLLMSWMGDHGLMRKLKVDFLAFHWQGDAIRVYATVTGKRVENGEHLIDLAISTLSHPRGEQTSKGTATVQLPSRGGDK
jgi:acyl dehydratase